VIGERVERVTILSLLKIISRQYFETSVISCNGSRSSDANLSYP
jgi:hypothetical protein